MPRRDRGDACRGTPERGVRQLTRMGIAGRLASDRAQPEAQRRVEAGTANPTVIQADLFALAIFEEQLAIVAAGQGRVEMPLRRCAVELAVRAFEKKPIGHRE